MKTTEVTTAEAAALLGCNSSRVRQRVLAGTLRPVGKVGQTFLFRRADILALLRSLEKRKPRKENGEHENSGGMPLTT